MNKIESINLKLDHQENLNFFVGEEKREQNKAFNIVYKKEEKERATLAILNWKSVHSKW